MSEYVDVLFDIVGESEPQPAKVKKSLFVRDLISNISREFKIEESADYELYFENAMAPINRSVSIESLNIRPDQKIFFGRSVLQHRRPLSSLATPATLSLLQINRVYPIQWQPALIGRPDPDPIHTALLVVNLDAMESSRYISRRQAQITEQDGQYFIELLATSNQTLLNGQILVPNRKYPLEDGNIIFLRISRLSLQFNLQK